MKTNKSDEKGRLAKTLNLAIIIPLRNNCKSSLRMLHELKRQRVGFENECRVLVVNDCSDDETKILLPQLQDELGFTMITPSDHRRGAGAMRNHGVKWVAENWGAQYVAFFDADDYLNDHAVPIILDALDKGADSVIWGFASICNDPNDNRIWLPKFKSPDQWYHTPVAPWLHAIRTHLVQPFPEELLTDDVIWWMRQADALMSYGAEFYFIPSPLYIYDKTSGGCTRASEWFGKHPKTLEQIITEDVCKVQRFPDRYVSDCIRNIAELYDLRNEIENEEIRDLLLERFKRDVVGLMTGRIGW